MDRSINASSTPKFTKANRELYFKISLNESEMKILDHKEKRVSKLFKENALLFNIPEFYRVLFRNFDDPDLQKIMIKLYREEVSPMFFIGDSQ